MTNMKKKILKLYDAKNALLGISFTSWLQWAWNKLLRDTAISILDEFIIHEENRIKKANAVHKKYADKNRDIIRETNKKYYLKKLWKNQNLK